MAKLTFEGLDDVMSELTKRADNADDIIGDMLEAGGEEVVGAWKEVAPHRTGGLQRSIKKSTPTLSADGGHTEVYPRGVNEYGTRYAEIAFILHYGTSRINATRFVDEAEKIGEERASQAMLAIWEAQQ